MTTLSARCPFCEETIQVAVNVDRPVDCPACRQNLVAACPDFDRAGEGLRCVTCPSTEFFVRKDFPQRLGVGIVLVGFAASTVAWYFHRVLLSFGILFGTALIDVVLYVFMGNVLECYRCHAQYRGLPSLDGHSGFNLEVHEKYRQQAARMNTNTPANPEEENHSESTSTA